MPKDIYFVLGNATDAMGKEAEDEIVSLGEHLHGADEVFDNND